MASARKIRDNNSKEDTQSTFWDILGDKIGIGNSARARKYNARQAEIAFEREQKSVNTAWEREQKAAELAWERQMSASNTAYQRAVTDLKEAGLNPILAAGSSASTPTAQMAHGQSASASAASGSAAEGESLATAINAVTGLVEAITNAKKNK